MSAEQADWGSVIENFDCTAILLQHSFRLAFGEPPPSEREARVRCKTFKLQFIVRLNTAFCDVRKRKNRALCVLSERLYVSENTLKRFKKALTIKVKVLQMRVENSWDL